MLLSWTDSHGRHHEAVASAHDLRLLRAWRNCPPEFLDAWELERYNSHIGFDTSWTTQHPTHTRRPVCTLN